MAVDHIAATSLDHDGKHLKVTLRPATDATPISTESANSITGSVAGRLVNLAQTWNTTGLCKALLITITNTASHASSLLMEILVGASSIFSIDVAGKIFERARTVAMGDWASYSPAWTNLTGGTPALGSGGTLVGRSARVGTTRTFNFTLTLGTGFTSGTALGTWAISLPSTPSASFDGNFLGHYFDASTGAVHTLLGRHGGSGVCVLYGVASTALVNSGFSPTPAAGDMIVVSGAYEE